LYDELQVLQSDVDDALLSFNILQPHSASGAQTVPRLFNATPETRIMFETVVKPVVFRLEPNQHTSRFAMPRDNDLPRLSLAKIARQIILDF
jgi:hypothetical protein